MVPMLKVIFAFLEPGGIGKTVGLELSGFKTLKTKWKKQLSGANN